MELVKKVLGTIKKHKMLSFGDKVLVAVSGGPDSVALFHLLFQLREEFSLRLVVAHYHHQLRGKEADLDEELVRGMAERFKVEYVSGSAERDWWKKRKGSLEERAREMRYEFLIRTASAVSADRIALGHNEDDLAEGFLINLLRGSGLLGLTGMPVKRDKFIRPLVEVSREEILEYLWENHLAFRVDRSNFSPRFLRNRIRSDLIPMLKSFNPALLSTLGKTMELLRAEENFLQAQAREVFARLAHLRPGRVSFYLPEFLKEELALRRRLVRLGIQAVKKDLRGMDSEHIFELEELLGTKKASFELDLPLGVRIFKSYDQLSIERPGIGILARFEPVQVQAPLEEKILLSEELALELKVERVGYEHFQKGERTPRGSLFELGSAQAFLSLDQISSPLWLRAPKPGDRLQPLGMTGHKKLKEILQELRVPRSLRLIYPVLSEERELLWAPGYEISERVKVKPGSQKIFLLKLGLQNK